MNRGTAIPIPAARLACLLLVGSLGGGGAPSEYELKAAVIFNILRFVDKGSTRSREFVTVGTYAAGPIEQALRTLEGSSVHGRRLRVRTLTNEAELAGCDAVFFGRSTGTVPRMLAQSTAGGTLTIGNDSAFVGSGGMMALLVESRRIVIEVNVTTAASAGWVISSHLLEVARVVKDSRK